MSGFLNLKPEPNLEQKSELFRHFPRVGGYYGHMITYYGLKLEFPAPREAWVVSYEYKDINFPDEMQFPPPLEV